MWVWAAAKGHEGVMARLLEAGASVDAKDGLGQTALILAALSGHEGVVARLLEAGASVDAKGDVGQTALIRAAENGYEGEELAARGEGTTGNKAFLLRRLHAAIVRLHMEAEDGDGLG